VAVRRRRVRAPAERDGRAITKRSVGASWAERAAMHLPVLLGEGKSRDWIGLMAIQTVRDPSVTPRTARRPPTRRASCLTGPANPTRYSHRCHSVPSRAARTGGRCGYGFRSVTVPPSVGARTVGVRTPGTRTPRPPFRELPVWACSSSGVQQAAPPNSLGPPGSASVGTIARQPPHPCTAEHRRPGSLGSPGRGVPAD
jgi:hypothetical protein